MLYFRVAHFPICVLTIKWPHSSTLIVFLCETELFQRGWRVFVTFNFVEFRGCGGSSDPCKNGKSREVGGPK